MISTTPIDVDAGDSNTFVDSSKLSQKSEDDMGKDFVDSRNGSNGDVGKPMGNVQLQLLDGNSNVFAVVKASIKREYVYMLITPVVKFQLSGYPRRITDRVRVPTQR